MISQASRQCTVELQALPSRIGQVRRIVSAQLRYWNLDCLIEKAALGVTELLTNVHQHARPDKVCTVEMELLLGRLTVSVHDHDPRLPAVNTSEALATSGRGLALIEAFSESWGARPHGEAGKVVWFTLPAPVQPAPSIPPLPVYGAATTGPFPAAVPFGDPALAARADHALTVVAAQAVPPDPTPPTGPATPAAPAVPAVPSGPVPSGPVPSGPAPFGPAPGHANRPTAAPPPPPPLPLTPPPVTPLPPRLP